MKLKRPEAFTFTMLTTQERDNVLQTFERVFGVEFAMYGKYVPRGPFADCVIWEERLDEIIVQLRGIFDDDEPASDDRMAEESTSPPPDDPHLMWELWFLFDRRDEAMMFRTALSVV
jgi:hypothetical protein